MSVCVGHYVRNIVLLRCFGLAIIGKACVDAGGRLCFLMSDHSDPWFIIMIIVVISVIVADNDAQWL